MFFSHQVSNFFLGTVMIAQVDSNPVLKSWAFLEGAGAIKKNIMGAVAGAVKPIYREPVPAEPEVKASKNGSQEPGAGPF